MLQKKFLVEAEKELGNAHRIQTDIIQKEAAGEKIDISVLFVHAQDHLMTAMAEKKFNRKYDWII